MNEPRPYQDGHDLLAMRNLIIARRKANTGTYYIHTGDLSWWLYYPPLEGDFWDHIYLWDDPAQPWQLLGWVLISPDWVGFDVYFQPDLRGSLQANEMYLWAEEKALQIACERGKTTIYGLWILHDDEVLGAYFRQREFGDDSPLEFSHSLDKQIGGQLDTGFPANRIIRRSAEFPTREVHAGVYSYSVDQTQYLRSAE